MNNAEFKREQSKVVSPPQGFRPHTGHEHSYNYAVLRKAKLKQYSKKSLIGLVILATIGGGLWASAEYFANIPVERSQMKFSYWQRVKHGATMSWMALQASLQSRENSALKSELPVVKLALQGKYLDKLNAKLPESGHTYYPGMVQIEGKVYKAKLRYRGDSLNHWAFPQKSWRVKLTKGKFYKGIQYFNLYQPRTQNQISEQLAYEMFERLNGVLTPRAFYTHVRKNRRFDGVRMFLEQVNTNFLTLRGRIAGDILIGDISTEDIYGKPVSERKKLFGAGDADSWRTLGVHVDKGSADAEHQAHPRVDAMLKMLNKPLSARELERALPEFIELEPTLRFMAALEIMGSSHIDGTHNQKWYLDPSSGLFSPIAWDALAYLWGNKPDIDMDPNLLFRKILQVPAFRARKNEIIWEAIHGPLHEDELVQHIAETADLMRKDVHDNPLKIRAIRTRIEYNSTADWEEAVRNLMAVTGERNEKLRGFLTPTDVKFKQTPGDQKLDLKIQVNSHAGTIVKSIALERPAGTEKQLPVVTLKRSGDTAGAERIQTVPHPKNPNLILLPIEEELQAGRVLRGGRGRITPMPTVFNYILDFGAEPLKVSRINLKHPLTGVSTQAAQAPLATKSIAGTWSQKQVEDITLNGEVVLAKDMVVHRHQKLTIRPGTKIVLKEGASLIALGAEIDVQGTKENPVVITGTDTQSPGGVFAAVKSPLVKMQHVKIRNTSSRGFRSAYFPGGLSLHHSKVDLKELDLENATMSVQYSFGAAKQVNISSNSGAPVHKQGSGVIFDPVPRAVAEPDPHYRDMLRYAGVGTPPRVEREFKFAISREDGTSGPVSLESLSKIVAEALAKATIQENKWRGPEFGKEPHYRYSISNDANTYRDIYFDSPENLNAKHDISYRLRHRFSSIDDHNSHLRFPKKPRFWPYRLEFQAKSGRESSAPGLSSIEEARLEFRQQSEPFTTASYPPPPPPWHLSEFIPWMSSGTYNGQIGTPAVHVLKTLAPLYPERSEFSFEPRVVVISQRARAHLLLKTPWGRGPNPDQAFIITLDSADVYPVDEYLGFVRSAPYQNKKAKLNNIGTILEMEIEFERNVSEGVDALESGADKIRQAFLDDQAQLVEVIREALQQKNLSLNAMSKSKYLQAVDLLRATN